MFQLLCAGCAPCVVILSSISFHVYVLRAWSCDRVVLVVRYRVACLPGVLPLLTPRDRVILPCVWVVWSGHVVTWSSVLLLLGSYRIVCARSGRTLCTRSGRDNITV